MPKQLFTITNPTQDRKAFVCEMGTPSQRTGWRALASEIIVVVFLLLAAIPASEVRAQGPESLIRGHGLVQELPVDQIIAVNESTGIVPHKFPKIPSAK
jgi:hypothetical protein